MSVTELRERLYRRIARVNDERVLEAIEILLAAHVSDDVHGALPPTEGVDQLAREGLSAGLEEAHRQAMRGEGVSAREFVEALRHAK